MRVSYTAQTGWQWLTYRQTIESGLELSYVQNRNLSLREDCILHARQTARKSDEMRLLVLPEAWNAVSAVRASPDSGHRRCGLSMERHAGRTFHLSGLRMCPHSLTAWPSIQPPTNRPWQAEIPNSQRRARIFDSLLRAFGGLPSVNIARKASDTFCYAFSHTPTSCNPIIKTH
jgi:hypothetical protein